MTAHPNDKNPKETRFKSLATSKKNHVKFLEELPNLSDRDEDLGQKAKEYRDKNPNANMSNVERLLRQQSDLKRRVNVRQGAGGRR